jgi:hypothetical protein
MLLRTVVGRARLIYKQLIKHKTRHNQCEHHHIFISILIRSKPLLDPHRGGIKKKPNRFFKQTSDTISLRFRVLLRHPRPHHALSMASHIRLAQRARRERPLGHWANIARTVYARFLSGGRRT